jgi:hypothetical protein
MSGHPSFLQLDRLELGLDDPETARHVAGCDECRAHVGRCQMPAPVPASTRARAERGARSTRLLTWLCGVPALIGVMALVAVEVRRGPGNDALTAKGSPSVAVYVKRGAAVRLWDGQAPLLVGDALQLKVFATGFTRVTVASLASSGIVELYSGALAARGETALPQSFIVEGDPGREVLLVVFSRAALSASELRRVGDDLPRTQRLWSTRIEFLKRGEKP